MNRPEERFCGGCGHALRATLAIKSYDVTTPIDLRDVLPDAAG